MAARRGILCHVDACLGGLHPPVPRPARTPGQALGPLGARSDLDLRRPPQVRLRQQGHLGDPLPRPPAGRPPALRHHQLARAASTVPRRWPAPVRPARSPPAGPCSTTWAPTAISNWPKPPTRHRRRCRPPSPTPRGWPSGDVPTPPCSPSGPTGTVIDTFALGRCVGRPGRVVLRPPDPAGQPPRHRAGRAPAGRRRAVRRPGRGDRRELRATGARARDRDTTYGTT